MPAGVSFPLVVKMGKWRRVVTITSVTQCTNVDLTVDQTRLPRSMTDAIGWQHSVPQHPADGDGHR
ncbi:MAG: hypothetical protein QM756_32625 [Polyangiaceae bacterium]